MIRFIDYFFYRTFLLVKKKKDSDDAKWSAFLFTGLYLSLFMVLIVCVVGLLYDNMFCKILKDHTLVFWMTTFILMPLILSFRYYHLININVIEKSYNALGNFHRKFINVVLLIVLITFTLYTKGSVI